ncbi:alpha/beta hydrolase [Nocardiopsis ansamitocini]|uniref:alpha/beta hydrolase n=1 Tax=Nocardiopsis ansamitocini TaxID=1670832 RepID=UPI002555874A|nr:alpha/beta fold hydrolase [Nocardiopsis ansamitocini]
MSDLLHDQLPRPEPRRQRLTTSDGVHIDSVLRKVGTRTAAVVLANGFTGTWRSPNTTMIADRMLAVGDVMTFDFRGHYDSSGECTVGDQEVLDLEAVVAHLREIGYTRIATVGFSMGAAVAVRHAGMFGGVSAVVAVSGPSRWFYRGTARMRLLTFGVEQPVGRLFLRLARKVRVVRRTWEVIPPDPTELAGAIAPAGLLVVHGDADSYFPVEHARRIHEAAADPKELWIEPGMGHAERAMTPKRAERVAVWLEPFLCSASDPAGPAGDDRRDE